MTLMVWILVLGLVQLFWLIAVWIKSGFLPAFGLFLYAALSSLVTVLLLVRDGSLVL